MLFFVFFNGAITLWLNLLYHDCKDFNLVLSNYLSFIICVATLICDLNNVKLKQVVGCGFCGNFLLKLLK